MKKKPFQQYFLVSIIPKIFEKKTREYPTLKPVNINSTKIPRYKERESPIMHIEHLETLVNMADYKD